MNYQIVELEEFSGIKATVYSILPDGTELTLFDSFINKHFVQFKEEVQHIIIRLETIGKRTGAREHFFKLNEGKLGDEICALFDEPDRSLRLYCIRWGNIAILIGGGGFKSKNIRAWQEDELLSKEVNILMNIAREIQQRIHDKEIIFSSDGSQLLGNLNFTDDE